MLVRPSGIIFVGLAALLSVPTSACAPDDEASRPAEQPQVGAVDTPVITGCCNVGPSEPTINGLRITVQSGVAVPTSDVSGNWIYAAPYSSAAIALFDGSAWLSRIADPMPSVPASSCAALSGKCDVFAWWDGTDVRLELSNWSTALTLQDGVAVKSTDPTRRHLGAVAINGAPGPLATVYDTAKSRNVWNRDNQVPRPIVGQDGSGAWSYTGTSLFREAHGASTSRVGVFVGAATPRGAYVSVQAQTQAIVTAPANTSGYVAVGIGIDSQTVNSAQISDIAQANNTWYGNAVARYEGYLPAGSHSISWLEGFSNGVTMYVLGTGATPPFGRSGLAGFIEM